MVVAPFFSALHTGNDKLYDMTEDMRQIQATGKHIISMKYVTRANRPKGRDAKLWGLTPQGYDSPVASISICLLKF